MLRTSLGRAGEEFVVLVGLRSADLVLPGGARLGLDPSSIVGILQAGVFGASGFRDAFAFLTHDPRLLGPTFYVQSVGVDSASGRLRTSNRVDAVIAPSREEFSPAWSASPPQRVLTLERDPAQSDSQNGDRLHTLWQTLQPGDALLVGAGRWSLERRVSLGLQGTSSAPIRILAAPGTKPVLTRSDANQNVLNLGDGPSARYVLLRGFEVTGGSAGIRIYQAEDLWIDECEIHHVGEAALTANTGHTARLHLTYNTIHDTAGYGEGMYLGGNDGIWVMRDSVIGKNHVSDTRNGTLQGDGIEVKQGSYGNLIADNYVHGTRYPCILVYGTGGNARNVIENNVCTGSLDVVMQVQGEAIVRNNLLVDGSYGFLSRDHQGQVRNLTVVHNTIVNARTAAYLRNWDGRPGMIFANNAAYSRDAYAIELATGSSGVALSGNVVLGGVLNASSGYVRGRGLTDFRGVSWTAATLDARPATGSALLGSADPGYSESIDLLGRRRNSPFESGCLEGP